MEQDINYFENATEYQRPLKYHIQDALIIVVAIIGIASDALLIYVFTRSKRLWTRTNLILINIAINDALFLLFLPDFSEGLLRAAFGNISICVRCLLESYTISLQLAAFMLVLCLVSNTILKTKKVTDRGFFFTFYCTFGTILLLETIGCTSHNIHPTLFHMVTLLAFVAMMLCLLFKECNFCYRKIRKRKSMNPNTILRINVARIYVYNWLIAMLLFVLTWRFQYVFLHLTSFLTPTYIVIYLACTEKKFRLVLMNSFRCNRERYDVDATMSIADDCSEIDVEDVNVSFVEVNNLVQNQT